MFDFIVNLIRVSLVALAIVIGFIIALWPLWISLAAFKMLGWI